jgi:LuxR family transcriptional regulator, maltose regulon positive regulatory protein
MKTVLLVDDHPVFRRGLSVLLEDEEDIQVVGEAGDGAEALALVREFLPDVVVMDITMPGMNGIEATKRLLTESPQTLVVALSIHSEKQFVRGMLQAGVSGYILKESAPEDLVKGIRAVLRGEGYLSPAITGLVVSEFRDSLSYAEDIDRATVDIVRTKLQQPCVPDDHIRRTRLLEVLQRNRQVPMILVSAPAGYGKTTLVASWLDQCGWPAAWISLDENDNDLRTFLIYFVHAVQSIFADAFSGMAPLLAAPGLLPAPVLAGHLLNSLALIKEHFVLVIDDFHHIEDRSIHSLLSDLLRHPPPCVHLTVIGRRDPFLPVASLRAQRRIVEIGVNDLRFTPVETLVFLQQAHKQPVEEATAVAWTERTEGWITGLRLAVLSVQNQGDLESMLSDLEGGPQYVMEYLFNEVLSHQRPDIRDSLLRLSILDRFCEPLCNAVLGQLEPGDEETGSRELISELKKQSLFIIGVGSEGRWFRFHHLFQQFLRHELKRSLSAGQIAALYSRSSEWSNRNGFVEESLEHALSAGTPGRAAEIIEEHRIEVMNSDKWYVLDRWLSALPYDERHRRPGILLAALWVAYCRFQEAEIVSLLKQIETLVDTWDEGVSGEMSFYKGYLSLSQGRSEDCLKYARQAREQLARGLHLLRADTEVFAGIALQSMGRKEEAIREQHEAEGAYRGQGSAILLTRTIATQSFVHFLSGDLRQSGGAAIRLQQVAKRQGSKFASLWGYYLEGICALNTFKLDEAQNLLGLVAEDRNLFHVRAAVSGMAGLALTQEFTKRVDDAEQTMRNLVVFASESGDPYNLVIADSLRARISLLRGELGAAETWVRGFDEEKPSVPTMVFFLEIPSITQCRVLVASGSDAGLKEALQRLSALSMKTEAIHNAHQMIEIGVLRVLALERLRRGDEALAVLTQVVNLAAPGGWIRPFVELGRPMVDLLKQLTGKEVAHDYLRRVISACEVQEAGIALRVTDDRTANLRIILQALSRRELDVLSLLSEGRSNKEIAEKLFLSAETVKKHVYNIYQKLQVRNRVEAMTRAKELGILLRDFTLPSATFADPHR